MNNKISLQDLAQGLAKRKKTTRKDAESFVRKVFDVIGEKLLEDDTVKIKGLGTFKVINVDSRESVNVNTGERIVIEPHSRITFAPHTTLRDAVNRPFADFETITLNEDTSTEEMALLPESPEDEPEPEIEDALPPVPQEETHEEEPPTEQQIATEDSMPEVVTETIDATEAQQEQEEQKEENPEAEQPEEAPEAPQPEENIQDTPQTPQPPEDKASNPEQKSKKGFRLSCGGLLVCLVMVLMLMAGSFYLGHKYGMRLFTDDIATPNTPVANSESAKQDTPTAVSGNVAQPASAPEQTKQETEDFSEKYPQVEGGEYWITGTKEEHTIVIGDNLLALSLSVYGDKSFATYIIKYNNIKDPDILMLGTTIKLPELRKKD